MSSPGTADSRESAPRRGASLFRHRVERVRDIVQYVLWRVPLLGRTIVAAERARLPRLPGRVLFVCDGNICRSALAEHAARRMASSAGGWRFASAGLIAKPGTQPPEQAVRTAAKLGVDLQSHRSRVISREDLTQSDVIFVMEPRQRRHWLLRGLRDTPGRPAVLLLGAWCRRGGPAAILRDPYGRDDATFAATFARVEDAVQELVEAFSPPAGHDADAVLAGAGRRGEPTKGRA